MAVRLDDLFDEQTPWVKRLTWRQWREIRDYLRGEESKLEVVRRLRAEEVMARKRQGGATISLYEHKGFWTINLVTGPDGADMNAEQAREMARKLEGWADEADKRNEAGNTVRATEG